LDLGGKRTSSPLQRLQDSLLGFDQLLPLGTARPLRSQDQDHEIQRIPELLRTILAVNNLNRQIIQLQMGINELVRFPTIAQYLMLPLDQREESLIKGCVKRQGNYFLLLDYDPTTEEDQFFSSMSLLLATPHFPPDLSEILGIETKSYQPSSIYCQEPEYSSDQDESAKPEETPGTREEDSPKDPLQEVEDWTEEERQPDYQPPTSKEEAEEDENSPFHEEDF